MTLGSSFYIQNNYEDERCEPASRGYGGAVGTDTISKGRELTFKLERLTKVAGIFEIEGGPRATRS